jgi:hypothetical protein
MQNPPIPAHYARKFVTGIISQPMAITKLKGTLRLAIAHWL